MFLNRLKLIDTPLGKDKSSKENKDGEMSLLTLEIFLFAPLWSQTFI